MNMKEIKKIARKIDITPGKMNKLELIRSIQVQEGYSPCYQSDQPFCDQYECCWRNDCQPGEMRRMQ